jgi:pimeloyl-ACP methyl ester carboxylesterase
MTALQADADDGARGRDRDIVLFVHGFNTSQDEFLVLYDRFCDGLARKFHHPDDGHSADGDSGPAESAYKGIVIGLDWPSNGSTLGYFSDRLDARQMAADLVRGVLAKLAAFQRPDCQVKVHLVAHSMGTFVTREAFDWADDESRIAAHSWSISQLVFIASDISAKSLGLGSSSTSSLLRRSARMTNFYSGHDGALSISNNVKRVGVSGRLGRVGAPNVRDGKVADVSCSHYYNQNKGALEQKSGVDGIRLSHNWYFFEDRFYEDLTYTLRGEIDRGAIPTRGRTSAGDMALLSAKDAAKAALVT